MHTHPPMRDSESDVECVGVVPPGPRRLTFAEEQHQPRLSSACCRAPPVPLPSTILIARQSSDTCLVHAIINATQRHDGLNAMLSTVRSVVGLKRKDVTAGIESARAILGVCIRNGFDATVDTMGIAHIYMTCGAGHFVALRRLDDGCVYVLDSLNGGAALLHDATYFRTRSTMYSIGWV